MDSAIYVYGSTNMIAKGVEHCKCPKRYDGLSCQDPGKGFYRYRNVTEIETVFIEDLIGRVVPCHCNGRSHECERETGICLVSTSLSSIWRLKTNLFSLNYLELPRQHGRWPL